MSFKKLTRNQRFEIVRDHKDGVTTGTLATRYGVTKRAIQYTVRSDVERQKSEGTRSITISSKITEDEAEAFGRLVEQYGFKTRAEAFRALIKVAQNVFQPTETEVVDLGKLAAQTFKVGGNVNQIAQRMNAARKKGTVPLYGVRDQAVLRDLTALVFEVADQVEAMAKRRGSGIELAISPQLREFANGT